MSHCRAGADVGADVVFHQKTERQSNRLSKFIYMGKGQASDTLATEEILLWSIPKATQIHAGGWVGFKPSAKKTSSVSIWWSQRLS